MSWQTFWKRPDRNQCGFFVDYAWSLPQLLNSAPNTRATMDDAHAPALTFEFHVIVCVTNQCSSFNFLQPLKNVKTILSLRLVLTQVAGQLLIGSCTALSRQILGLCSQRIAQGLARDRCSVHDGGMNE